LNDVDLGGATAYPRIGAHVNPSRGSALMMFNHGADGNISYDMTHGGCPVLFGSKTSKLIIAILHVLFQGSSC
jgi:prolyl 4-hydroxylase